MLDHFTVVIQVRDLSWFDSVLTEKVLMKMLGVRYIQLLLWLAISHSVTSQVTEDVISGTIPSCAQQCVRNSISSNFKQACPDSTDITCLCTNYDTDGYTLGEAALSCLYSSVCGQDALQSATPVYQICNNISNASKPTHSSVVGSIFGTSAVAARVPSITPPTVTASATSLPVSSTTKPATTSPANQGSSRRLDNTQIAAVVIASIALFVVAVTAIALMCLRSKRRPLDVEAIKAICNELEDSSGPRTEPTHNNESKRSRSSLPGRSSNGKPKSWPKYYRVSPPPHLRLSSLLGLASANPKPRSTEHEDIPSGPRTLSIVKKPSTINSRRTVRVSGFSDIHPAIRKPVPPVRSPLRSTHARNLSIKIPDTSIKKAPVRVQDPATNNIDEPRTTPSTPKSPKSRNTIQEISRAASSGGHQSYHLPLNSSGERVYPTRSEASSVYSTIESSPSFRRQRRSEPARKHSRRTRNVRGTESSTHDMYRFDDHSESDTERRQKKELEMSPLPESPSSPIANLSYPRIPKARTVNMVSRSNSSTPKKFTHGHPLHSYGSASIIRESQNGQFHVSSSHLDVTRTPTEQKRWITNSAPSLGPLSFPDRTYTPMYHFSKEIEQQQQYTGPAASWPGAKATNNYGFF